METNNEKLNHLIMDECVLGKRFVEFYPEFAQSTLLLGEVINICDVETMTFKGKDLQIFTIKRSDGTTIQLGRRHFNNISFKNWVKPLKVVGIVKISSIHHLKPLLTYRFEVVE
jgi:hypothetical protein